MNEWEPNGHEKWVQYLDTCAAYLDCGIPNFIEEKLELTSFPAFIWEALREKGKRWPLKPHSSVLSELFESPKMVALASFQDLYVGLEPYENQEELLGGILRKTAPAVFGLLSAIELHPTNRRAGVFAPLGGFRQVTKSMVELCADNGVEFVFNATVTSIGGDGVYFRHGSSKMFRSADLVVCSKCPRVCVPLMHTALTPLLYSIQMQTFPMLESRSSTKKKMMCTKKGTIGTILSTLAAV